MGNYHAPFWRAVGEVTPSLTLIENTAINESPLVRCVRLLRDNRSHNSHAASNQNLDLSRLNVAATAIDAHY